MKKSDNLLDRRSGEKKSLHLHHLSHANKINRLEMCVQGRMGSPRSWRGFSAVLAEIIPDGSAVWDHKTPTTADKPKRVSSSGGD